MKGEWGIVDGEGRSTFSSPSYIYHLSKKLSKVFFSMWQMKNNHGEFLQQAIKERYTVEETYYIWLKHPFILTTTEGRLSFIKKRLPYIKLF